MDDAWTRIERHTQVLKRYDDYHHALSHDTKTGLSRGNQGVLHWCSISIVRFGIATTSMTASLSELATPQLEPSRISMVWFNVIRNA